MSPVRAAGATLTALVALAAAGGASGAAPVNQRSDRHSAHTSASRVQVVADEWRLSPSRGTLPAGRTKLEVVNVGQDDHNVKIRRRGGTAVSSNIVHPGDRETLSLKLKPGKYKLWCSLADHKRRGMRASITVR